MFYVTSGEEIEWQIKLTDAHYTATSSDRESVEFIICEMQNMLKIE